jgi:NTE family protein
MTRAGANGARIVSINARNSMQNKVVTLALQGGGSHGAFTWGVLDRLLQDGRIDIEGISGASAGAMNAAVMAHGYNQAGRDGAREALAAFWGRIATREPFRLFPAEMQPGGASLLNQQVPAAMQALVAMTRFFSPTQLNPLDINPLRDILQEQIDFDRLRRTGTIKLFIAATKVSSGTLKIFRNHDLTLDALLASACLPSLHRPVEIDGEAYWDGGLTANPPIFPLLHLCSSHDLLVVLLHPCSRLGTPTSTTEIGLRLSEISFSSAFFTELGGLALAKREAEGTMFAFGTLERRLKRLNMHMVEAHDLMNQLDVTSKLNTSTSFIHAMQAEGRAAAEDWLERHFHQLGVTSSFDLGRYLQ